jgi:hypothetical protein
MSQTEGGFKLYVSNRVDPCTCPARSTLTARNNGPAISPGRLTLERSHSAVVWTGSNRIRGAAGFAPEPPSLLRWERRQA